jgi:hypothetical protein
LGLLAFRRSTTTVTMNSFPLSELNTNTKKHTIESATRKYRNLLT